jgi:aerotaxis receptor
LKKNLPITDNEAWFREADRIISTTNLKGIITSVNDTFIRISGFSRDELIGFNHNVVRHPDMPRGVFWLMWETIKSGKPMGAYVKNRTADGRYYWVFALATPNDDGYFSVRIKPSAPLLDDVKKVYAELRAAENEGEMTPEQSAKRLLERLAEHGFPDYETFQARALSGELASRDEALGRPVDRTLIGFKALATAMDAVIDKASEMGHTFEDVKMLPWNIRIAASRLEGSNGPITSIADAYTMMATEIMSVVDQFLRGDESAQKRIHRTIAEAQFLVSASRMQREVADVVAKDDKVTEFVDVDYERSRLRSQAERYEEWASTSLRAVTDGTREIGSNLADLGQLVSALSMTRTICRVESARLTESGDSLAPVVRRFDAFQEVADAQMLEINRLNSDAQASAESLRQEVASAAAA